MLTGSNLVLNWFGSGFQSTLTLTINARIANGVILGTTKGLKVKYRSVFELSPTAPAGQDLNWPSDGTKKNRIFSQNIIIL